MQTATSPHDSTETTPVGSPGGVNKDYDMKDAVVSQPQAEDEDVLLVEDCLMGLCCLSQAAMVASTTSNTPKSVPVSPGIAPFIGASPAEGPSVKSPQGSKVTVKLHFPPKPSPGPATVTSPNLQEQLAPLSLDDGPEETSTESKSPVSALPQATIQVPVPVSTTTPAVSAPKPSASPTDLLPELAAVAAAQKAIPVDTVSLRLKSCEGGSSLPSGTKGEGSTRSILSIPPKDNRKRRYEWLSKYAFVRDADSRAKIAELESRLAHEVGKHSSGDPLKPSQSPDFHSYTSPLMGSMSSPSLSPAMMPSPAMVPHHLLPGLDTVVDASGKRKRRYTRYNKMNFSLEEIDKRGLQPPPQSPREGCSRITALHMPQLLLSALEAETEAKKKPRKRRRYNSDSPAGALSPMHPPFSAPLLPAPSPKMAPVAASSCSSSLPPSPSPPGSGCDSSSPSLTPTASPMPSPALAPAVHALGSAYTVPVIQGGKH